MPSFLGGRVVEPETRPRCLSSRAGRLSLRLFASPARPNPVPQYDGPFVEKLHRAGVLLVARSPHPAGGFGNPSERVLRNPEPADCPVIAPPRSAVPSRPKASGDQTFGNVPPTPSPGEEAAGRRGPSQGFGVSLVTRFFLQLTLASTATYRRVDKGPVLLRVPCGALARVPLTAVLSLRVPRLCE